MKISIGETRSDLAGFSALARLAAKLEACWLDTIELDLSPCSWFDTNMSAPLGVLTTASADKLNELTISGIHPGVQTILAKNGFLTGFVYSPRPDIYGTAIPSQRFKTDDERAFAEYLEHHLNPHPLDRIYRPWTGSGDRSEFERSAASLLSGENLMTCGTVQQQKFDQLQDNIERMPNRRVTINLEYRAIAR